MEDRTGILLPVEKHAMVTARIARRVQRLGLARYASYAEHVVQPENASELTALVDALTTNKTSFYRERAHFDVLARHLAGPAARTASPRLWSAGCSSGQEPYTMAITALASGASRVRILATDLSTRVLDIARAGRYPFAEAADIPKQKLATHFAREGAEVVVSPELRARVAFAQLNFRDSWPMRGPFEAIFCRNVMIYFDRAMRTDLVARFRELLSPGGLLFIGLSEGLVGEHGLRLVAPGVYRR